MTVSDIAQMAGTARSTVSNWKRRHADFPTAKDHTPRGPLYDRREVAEWLERRGGVARVPAPTSRAIAGGLWKLGDLVRDTWSPDQFALVATRLALGLPIPNHEHRHLDLRRWEQVEHGVDDLITAAEDDREAVVRTLLDAYADAGRMTAGHVTPQHLVRFATRLLGPRTSVLDPACGAGGLLAACADTAKLVCGQELNPDMAELAGARLALLTENRAGRSQVESGDALSDDRFPTLFDGVISSPPWRTRLEPGVLPEGDARWVYDYPRSSGDAAWIQHVVAHIAPGGRAVMVLAPATLFEHGVVGSVRAGLVRSGILRAAVQLPRNTLSNTGVAPVVVVLERPLEPHPHPTVLLAEPLPELAGRSGEWPNADSDAAADAISSWLSGQLAGTDLDDAAYAEMPLGDLAADDFDLTPRRHLHVGDLEIAPLHQVRAELNDTAAAVDPDIDRMVTAIGAARELVPLEPATAQRVPLGDLVEIRRGIPLHQLAHHGDFPVHSPDTLLRGNAPTRFLADDAPELQTAAPVFNALPGDVLISLDGEIGAVHVVTQEMFVTSTFAILRPRHHHDDRSTLSPKFLGAWLRSTEAQAALQHLAKGSTMRRVAKKDLTALSIPTPEPELQEAISEFDDKLDAALTAVRDLTETVERLRQLGQQSVAATLPKGRQ
jgi:SAM-dependent methyltransferase